MTHLSLKNIGKMYPGNVHAVSDFSIDIEEGEFIVLVGPSGCGKSTILRMIAGLEDISSGDMNLREKKINHLAPSDREVAMVFQDYALYGNMTVYQNIGFSLTIRGEKADQIHEKVMEVSKTVELSDYLNRHPKSLSGGQKQRVAMGRSLAKQVKLLLMDEPLSNLDAKLRQQTRRELAVLHHKYSPTIIYVTHDQIEAMTLATRIVVMNEGHIQQTGSPQEIYRYPENIFTASFIGTPQINLLPGRINEGRFVCTGKNLNPLLSCFVPQAVLMQSGKYGQGGIVLGLRPENIRLLQGRELLSDNEFAASAVVETLELLGAEYNAGLDMGGCSLNS
ncbi:MAG: ABC transporter ATP-binding protein, partial [Treponema sp.]|nr:ABC transporter ATP-binding protein [Treponema sp.]